MRAPAPGKMPVWPSRPAQPGIAASRSRSTRAWSSVSVGIRALTASAAATQVARGSPCQGSGWRRSRASRRASMSARQPSSRESVDGAGEGARATRPRSGSERPRSRTTALRRPASDSTARPSRTGHEECHEPECDDAKYPAPGPHRTLQSAVHRDPHLRPWPRWSRARVRPRPPPRRRRSRQGQHVRRPRPSRARP